MGIAFASVMLALEHKRRASDRSQKPKFKADDYKKIEARLSGSQIKLLKSLVTELEDEDYIESERICPECKRNFRLIKLDDIFVDGCRFCKSLWFDAGELKSITGLLKDVPSDNLRNRDSKYECPICYTRMKEYIFKEPHNLLVDRCSFDHGVYLESGELVRVFTSINEKDT